MWAESLNSRESAITKYADQEDSKQNAQLWWGFDVLLYTVFLKKKNANLFG